MHFQRKVNGDIFFVAALFYRLTAPGPVTEFITTLEVEVISTADLTTIKFIQGFFFFLLDFSFSHAVFLFIYFLYSTGLKEMNLTSMLAKFLMFITIISASIINILKTLSGNHPSIRHVHAFVNY